jgi:Methyltransferase domain
VSERHFREVLRTEACWDRSTQALFEAEGEPAQDRMLQNREELIGLCAFIERAHIRSYLEIGIWTGRLLCTLHRLFRFDRVAACDHGWATHLGLPIRVPAEARCFWGDSESPAYREWRAELGRVDLVLIDANHGYHAVQRDFAINRTFPHRFLAFHDIVGASRATAGVKRFWDELAEGHKREIVRPHLELGLDHSTMGIGIWSEGEPI